MSEPPPNSKTARCAICGKPQDAKFKPFCSKRCADRDLGKWLGEGYAIPGEPLSSMRVEEPDADSE
jgi:endogenous inhibitor of DNA gyrase (YacG/DUF329 family)